MRNKDIFKSPVLLPKATVSNGAVCLTLSESMSLGTEEQAPRNVFPHQALLQGHTLSVISHSPLIRSKLKLHKN